MPRSSGTGVYSPPSNITAVSGAPVESADWNALVQDITTVMNGAWPVGLGGTGVSSLVGFLATLGGLPLTGGTLTGPLNLSGDATASLQPVTKQQFDTGLAGKADVAHSQTASTITDFAAAADARISAASINALSDVTITSPVNGQILKVVSGVFVNSTLYTEHNLGSLASLGYGASKITQAHGLGARPSRVEALFRCRVASQGFSSGDEGPLNNVLTADTSYGANVYWDAVNVFVSGYSNYYVITPSGTNVPLTNSNFDLIIRVFP